MGREDDSCTANTKYLVGFGDVNFQRLNIWQVERSCWIASEHDYIPEKIFILQTIKENPKNISWFHQDG